MSPKNRLTGISWAGEGWLAEADQFGTADCLFRKDRPGSGDIPRKSMYRQALRSQGVLRQAGRRITRTERQGTKGTNS